MSSFEGGRSACERRERNVKHTPDRTARSGETPHRRRSGSRANKTPLFDFRASLAFQLKEARSTPVQEKENRAAGMKQSKSASQLLSRIFGSSVLLRSSLFLQEGRALERAVPVTESFFSFSLKEKSAVRNAFETELLRTEARPCSLLLFALSLPLFRSSALCALAKRNFRVLRPGKLLYQQSTETVTFLAYVKFQKFSGPLKRGFGLLKPGTPNFRVVSLCLFPFANVEK